MRILKKYKESLAVEYRDELDTKFKILPLTKELQKKIKVIAENGISYNVLLFTSVGVWTSGKGGFFKFEDASFQYDDIESYPDPDPDPVHVGYEVLALDKTSNNSYKGIVTYGNDLKKIYSIRNVTTNTITHGIGRKEILILNKCKSARLNKSLLVTCKELTLREKVEKYIKDKEKKI